jgi:hypothetical protein
MRRFLMRMLPALLVAAAWLAWWVAPERPLRTCPFETKGPWGAVIRPADGAWSIVVPNDAKNPSNMDFVLRFDPMQGKIERLPTPN